MKLDPSSPACAAGLKNLEILDRERLVENAARLQPLLEEELERTRSACSGISNVSCIGLLSSMEFEASHPLSTIDGLEIFRRECYKRGVALRGYPGVVYFYPPLVVGPEDVRLAFEVARMALAGL